MFLLRKSTFGRALMFLQLLFKKKKKKKKKKKCGCCYRGPMLHFVLCKVGIN